MIRTFLFIAVVSLCAGAMSVPAFAESGKGWFGFFNRSKTENSGTTAPVHMSPDVAGTSATSDTSPLNLGKKTRSVQTANLVAEEERRKEQSINEWQERETAITRARVQDSLAKMQAQMAYNEKVALQAQAQKIAQIEKDAIAGIVRMPAQQPQQSYARPIPVVPTVTEPAAEAVDPAAAAKPPRERKPRQFFNRTE